MSLIRVSEPDRDQLLDSRTDHLITVIAEEAFDVTVGQQPLSSNPRASAPPPPTSPAPLSAPPLSPPYTPPYPQEHPHTPPHPPSQLPPQTLPPPHPP